MTEVEEIVKHTIHDTLKSIIKSVKENGRDSISLSELEQVVKTFRKHQALKN